MLECGIEKLHLAHIDHGWRESSRSGAEDLEREAARLGCPFHSIRLVPIGKGNREDEARQERLKFFHSLFAGIPFQALLLAHHEKDLAETVLKRIFEGAHLSNLMGMSPDSVLDGIAVWRPFLSVKKKEIVQFLDAKELIPISDPTNLDPAFLRGRMRNELFPFLNRVFGKEIDGNLALMSERAAELKDYLDRKVEAYLQRAERGAWRGMYGLKVVTEGLERIEKRHLIQRAAAMESLSLPRTILEPLLDSLEKRASASLKKFKIRFRVILIEGETVFFQSEKAQSTFSKNSFSIIQNPQSQLRKG
jgi:tRNA(Ile)-lysidine synthase